MTVRSDPQQSSFPQFYDEDGDDDSDDNHFIISLEDNGDEDEPDYNPGSKSSDFPTEQVSVGFGREPPPYTSLYQHDWGPSNGKSVSLLTKLGDPKGSSEQEILTFPTSCISKPISHTHSSKEQTINAVAQSTISAHRNVSQPPQDPVSFLSPYQENSNYPTSKELPETSHMDPGTVHMRSEDVVHFRGDGAFVSNSNIVKGVSIEQKQSFSESVNDSTASFVLKSVFTCVSTSKTTPSIISRTSNVQANVPKLSGPFPQRSKIATHITHSNSCSCIMCSEVMPSDTSLSQKLPTPHLTREEIQIIENGSHRWQRKQKTGAKSNLQSEPSVNLLGSVNSALPKLTPSRELSAAMSIPVEQRSKKQDSRQRNNMNTTLNTAAPPLLLHKSAIKRDQPKLKTTLAPPFSGSQVPTSHTQHLKTLSHPVPVSAILLVSSANNSKPLSTSSSNQSNRISSTAPLLFQGSTNGDKIGSLTMKTPTSQSLFNISQTKDLNFSHHDPKHISSNDVFLKPNDSNSSGVSVSNMQTIPVTCFDSVHNITVPIKPLYTTSSDRVCLPIVSTEVHPKQQVQADRTVSLLNSSLLRQELKKPALTSDSGSAKTFQHDPVGQQSTQPSHIGAYKIVYLNSGEVLLCRPTANLQTEATKSSTAPKKNQSQVTPGPLTVTGNTQALNSVLNKAQQIDLTKPGTVRIKLNGSVGLNVMPVTNPASSVKTCKAQVPTPSQVKSQSASVSHSFHPSVQKNLVKNGHPAQQVLVKSSNSAQQSPLTKANTTQQSFVTKTNSIQQSLVKNANPAPEGSVKKSPPKLPKAPNVTGSTLLKLIDTHIENQQLTSNEAALLQLIKGACKDPELLAATCKIAKQVESASLLKSKAAAKEFGTSSQVVPAAKPPDATFKPSTVTKVSQSKTTSASSSINKQSGNKGTFLSSSTQHLFELERSTEKTLHGKLSSTGATKMGSEIPSNQPHTNVVPEQEPPSHFKCPEPPREGLPASYIEDWVNQSKTFMSNNKLEDLFYQEIREIDRCVTNEVLSHYKQSGVNFESQVQKDELKSKNTQSLNSKNCLPMRVLNKDAESLSHGHEDKEKTHSGDKLAESTASENLIKFRTMSNAPRAKKLKHLSSLVPTSKGIKLKIRLDEKLKRHKAFRKQALGEKTSKFPETSLTHTLDSSITEPTDICTIDKAQDQTKESLPSDNNSNLIVNNEDKKESRVETAEEMFQRFQEQAQEEVYKAQLGVGCLSRSLRPARATVAFLDKLPIRDMGCGERKKKKIETDQTGDQAKSLGNDTQQASLRANDAEVTTNNLDTKDKASGSIKKKWTPSGSPKVCKAKEPNVGVSTGNHPNLKEDMSFPLTKNVYCSNILAGHKVFVRFNTYENLSTERCFLIPFFNIGGKRKQFDVEDVRYFNKAIIDFEKEERSCARHLLYFCREGKKASFLRKEGSFGATQLHERNYCKKSFTLEGFKMSAVKPKSSTAQEAWEVDKEVDIEIDTAEVDNDIEVDFDNDFLENNDLKLKQPLEMSPKENGLLTTSSSTNLNQPVLKTVSDKHLSVNAEEEKVSLNLPAVSDDVTKTCQSEPKDASGIDQLASKPDKLFSEEYQDAYLPQAVSSEETMVSNTQDTDLTLSLSEIKKEVPDYNEYGSEFASSTSMYQSGPPMNLFQPVFSMIEVKKEPTSNGYDDDDEAHLNSECPPESANIQSMNGTHQTEGRSSLPPKENEALKVAPSFVSELDQPMFKTTNNKDSSVPKSCDKPTFEESPSSIICTEIHACDAEKVQVSLSDEQVNHAPQIQDNSCSKLTESPNHVKRDEDPQNSEQDVNEIKSSEIMTGISEDTVTGSEGPRPSSPESPAPSSSISESSEVLSSSDVDVSDLDCGLSSSEAHLSHSSTPSVDLMAGSEGKTGAGPPKITSLVESLRQRLKQQSSNLPPWLATSAPPVVHSRLKTKRKKHKRCKAKTDNENNGCKLVQQNTTVQVGHQVSSCISASVSASETLISDSSHLSDKVKATPETLLHKDAEGEHCPSASLPGTTEVPNLLPLANNTQSKLPLKEGVLVNRNTSKEEGSLIQTTLASSIAEQNGCAETHAADIPSSRATALLSLSLLTGLETSGNGLASSISHTLPSTTSNADVRVKQEILEEDIDPSSIKFGGDHAIAAELESDPNPGQTDEKNCLIQTPGKEKQETSEVQMSARSTPSDIDIEVGCDDLPEAAMRFQPIVPDVYIDVDQSDSSSESSCLSPVAAVVDFLHKRTQEHSKSGGGFIGKDLESRKLPVPVTKDTSVTAEERGSVTSYLTQKYAVDMTPSSGVWHTIKGPRLRKSAVKRPAACTATKLETSAAPMSVKLTVVEPISTKELSEKPSLSEIFGIPVKFNAEPESEQNLIKTEPVLESGAKITLKIRGSKRQVARKRTFTKTMKKDDSLGDNLLNSKAEPVKTEPNTDLPLQLTDSVTSLADSNLSSMPSEDLVEKPAKCSPGSDTSSVKSKNLSHNLSSSVPKVRLTWRQLSKLSEKQQKETELNKVTPCNVLLSRLEDTDLSSIIEPIDPFTFRVKREPINVRGDSATLKLETDDSQGGDVNNLSQTNKGRINKRKKKKTSLGRSKKGSTKPKKDIVDHFASMLESLRKKALQLEEEATRKQQEEEAMRKQQEEEEKKNDIDTKNINLSQTESKQIVKEEPPSEKILASDENVTNIAETILEDVMDSKETHFPPISSNSELQGDQIVDHNIKDASRQNNSEEINQKPGTVEEEKLQTAENITIRDGYQCTFEKATNETKDKENIAMKPLSNEATSKKMIDSNQEQDTEGSAGNMSMEPSSSSNKNLEVNSVESDQQRDEAAHEGNLTEPTVLCKKSDDETLETDLVVDRLVNGENITKQPVSLSNKMLEDNIVENTLDGDERWHMDNMTNQSVLNKRPGHETVEINLAADETESAKKQPVLNDKLAETKSSDLSSVEKSDSKEEKETLVVKKIPNHLQAGLDVSQINLKMMVKNLAYVSQKAKIMLSEERNEVELPDKNMIFETVTNKEARIDREDVETDHKASLRSDQTNSHIDAKGEEAERTTDVMEDCEEEDASMDWEEEGALIIHLPEDEVVVQKENKDEKSTSAENTSGDGDIIKHKDHLSSKQTSDHKISTAKQIESEDKRLFDPHGDQEASNNARQADLKDDSLSTFCCNISTRKSEVQTGNKVLDTVMEEWGGNAEEEKLTSLVNSPFNFPKTDVVLGSVVDDLAACLVEKGSKKDEFVMFEHSEDLEGDDVGIIPQDEVERLLGLCDEDSEPLVLPGLGPVPSFETAASSSSATHWQSLNLQSPKENSASPTTFISKLTTNVDLDLQSNGSDKGQSKEAISSRKSEILKQVSSNHTYRLPSQTTVLRESTSPGHQTSGKILADFDKANESKDIEKGLRDTENGKPKPTQHLQLPKLKLDAKAMAAIQKAKSAFLKKKNVNQKRNLRSNINTEAVSNTGNSMDSQFQLDMAFYMRSTIRGMAEGDESENLNTCKSSVAAEQQHPKPGLSTDSSKTCQMTAVTRKQNLDDISDSCEKGTISKQTTALTRSSSISKSNSLATQPVSQVESYESSTNTRKRKVDDQSPLESSPSATKVKKVESIFNDTDIFKEPLSEETRQTSLNKSTKPVTPVSEILKKTKGIDISKLKMKLNPVLSKSGTVSSSQSSKGSEDKTNMQGKTNQTSLSVTKTEPYKCENHTSSSFPLNPIKSNTDTRKEKSPSRETDTRNLQGTPVDSCDEKASVKSLPNLNTAKLCNLLKNIQKRPVDVKSDNGHSQTGKSSVLETESQEAYLAGKSWTSRAQRLSRKVTKQGKQSNLSSAKESNSSNAFRKSQNNPTSDSVVKSLDTDRGTKRAAEEPEDKTERSFFDCLSTDQTEIWEEAAHQ